MKKISLMVIISMLLSGCTVEKISVESLQDEMSYSDEIHTDNQIDEDKEMANMLDKEDKDSDLIGEEEAPSVIDYEKVKPNELGHIMIVMYHGIIDAPPFHRTAEDFKKDLTYMYEHGYRLISMRDYIDNNIDVEAGMTPIVLTFDDGLASTFSLIEEGGELVPAPNTAIAILEAFAEEYPDFGKTATLYINSGNQVFEGAGTEAERLQWLIDHGYEIGNHTHTHAHLYDLDAEGIQEEIGKTNNYIKDILGDDYVVDSLSYPFGERPIQELRALALKGSYDEKIYENFLALKEGASGPFVVPYHKDFDPLLVPRARGSEGDIQDLWWFFDYYEKHPERRYISDGNKDLISIPQALEDEVNQDAVGKEIYFY